jgi:hypothetical protein
MDAAAIIAILSVSFAGAVSLIHAIFTNMSLSRCSDINCCCITCKRDVLHGGDLKQMTEAAEPNHEENNRV